MYNLIQRKIVFWRWPIMLALFITFAPGLLAPLLAQQGRGAEMFLRTGCPLLCCNDVQVPDAGPVGNAILLLIGIAAIVIFIATASYEENKRLKYEKEQQELDRQRQQAHALKTAQDIEKYGNWKGRKVQLQNFNNKPTTGVVVDQDADLLTIHFLSDDGQLEVTSKKIADIQEAKNNENPN